VDVWRSGGITPSFLILALDGREWLVLPTRKQSSVFIISLYKSMNGSQSQSRCFKEE
jgi:hypothetical protein